MSAVRSVLLASMVLVPLGCKRGTATVEPEPEPEPVEAPKQEPRPPLDPSPSEQLSARHFADVVIDESLSLPGGFVVAFSYDRFESEVGALAKDGIDIRVEIDAAIAECEEDRAELSDDELMWIESEERTCDEHAVSMVLDDDLLTPGCLALGVATFDLEGTLLQEQRLEDRCRSSLDRFELRDLSPLADPDVVLVASFEVYGRFSRGGWGTVESNTVLHLLAASGPDGTPVLHELARIELDEETNDGSCSYGEHRVLDLADDRALLRYTQRWNECADEECIDPADVDEDEDVDPDELCIDDPIELERAAWDEPERMWSDFDMEGEWTEGTLLPDGVLD